MKNVYGLSLGRLEAYLTYKRPIHCFFFLFSVVKGTMIVGFAVLPLQIAMITIGKFT